MSRLKQIKAQQKQVRTPKKEHKKQTGLPVYNSRGKNITPSRKQKQKKLGITLIICSGIFAFIYLPQYFYVPTAQTVNVSTDITAIRKANTVLREDPSGDYDGDGLSNADEETNGTDPWNIDSIIGVFEISRGTVAASLLSAREILIRMLIVGATHFLICHNHPSGHLQSSEE